MRGRPSKEFLLWRLDTKKDLNFGVPLFSLFVYKMFRVYVNVSFSNKILVLFFTRKCLLSIRTPNIESPFRPKKTYLVETRQSIKQTPKRPKKKEVVGKETPRTFRVSWCVRGDDSFLWRPTNVSSFIHSRTKECTRARVCIHTYIYIYTRIRAFREPEEEGAFFVSLSPLSLFSVFCFVRQSADSIESAFSKSLFHIILTRMKRRQTPLL